MERVSWESAVGGTESSTALTQEPRKVPADLQRISTDVRLKAPEPRRSAGRRGWFHPAAGRPGRLQPVNFLSSSDRPISSPGLFPSASPRSSSILSDQRARCARCRMQQRLPSPWSFHISQGWGDCDAARKARSASAFVDEAFKGETPRVRGISACRRTMVRMHLCVCVGDYSLGLPSSNPDWGRA